MSKKTTGSKAPKAKKPGKKPTVAEAVAAQKAEAAAAVEQAVVVAVTSEDAAIMAPAPKARGKKAKAAKVAGPHKPKMRDDGTYSVLDATHKVLVEAGTPLNCQTILERALAEGWWKTEGKTPASTIYAAVLRDIAAKGDQSRFKKTDRGLFASAN